jgi:hypothetical protein
VLQSYTNIHRKLQILESFTGKQPPSC